MSNEEYSGNQQSYPDIVCDAKTKTVFVFGDFLGKGSFGNCFVVQEIRSKKLYASKIVERCVLEHPVHSCFLLGELAIHESLRHKNVVAYHQSFADNKFIYIILELCSNGTLMELQKRRQCLTLLEAKYYLHHIINGVAYLHKKHIVHGDLKLSNIFISSRMVVKIGDFGLATSVPEGDEIIMQCGTPNYMAPEIIQMKGHSYAVDIWAIGCILYGLLVGKLPFQGNENHTTFEKIIKCEFSVYEPGLRKQVSSFIRKILRKNPEERPSITELNNDDFMLGFIPQTLPKYTMWEPPLPRDLLPVRRSKSYCSSTSKGKNQNNLARNVTINRRMRMKPSIPKITCYRPYNILVA